MNEALRKLLYFLKNAALLNKKALTLDCNKSYFPLLKLLYKEGFILHYLKTSNLVKVWLGDFHNKNDLKTIKTYSTIAKHICLSYLQITKLRIKNRLLVFSTSKGLLSSIECKNLKIGGLLLILC
jgi:ribosomal protein S8